MVISCYKSYQLSHLSPPHRISASRRYTYGRQKQRGEGSRRRQFASSKPPKYTSHRNDDDDDDNYRVKKLVRSARTNGFDAN
jgi:hypothetical protein